ncbi:MAG: 16S rRNA (cytosine(967)-C(5))-methyltransferase RsmB [Deltaproteobacteria bacterium]|nr:16S rRNA (cytosine(967)-C(5))-methyltransferase RsmB [Deltaproteobacteria bacterium]
MPIPERSPRRIAVDILSRIETKGEFAEPLLDAVLSGSALDDIHDRRLLTEIVYGSLRMRGRLDWIIGRHLRGSPASLKPDVRNILRTALYQIHFLDRIPDYAVVDEAVGLSKALDPARSKLVNGLLRNALRHRDRMDFPEEAKDPARHLSVVHSHPLWLVRRWIGLIGFARTEALCRANNEVPPCTFRVNRLRARRDEVILRLRRDGFDAEACLFSPDGVFLKGGAGSLRESEDFCRGNIQIQDEASQLVALLVHPEPGERILDLCAGAGGKTTHLAEIMGNQGQIIAVDTVPGRLECLRDVARRLGIGIVTTVQGDAASAPKAAFRGAFDRVLVDAPCSGLGTLRRNPEIKWRLRPGACKRLAALQKTILMQAALCLRAGGTLVYSTCTLMPEENEEVIGDFLAGHGMFGSTPPPATIDGTLVDGEGFLRTSPVRGEMDGFFGAVLKKDR